MKHFTRLLFSFTMLLTAITVQAQNKQVSTPIRHNYITWQQYDSLGDAAMFRGDTSEAIACYERSIELNPGDKEKVAAREKIKRHYRHVTSSFYLKEY